MALRQSFSKIEVIVRKEGGAELSSAPGVSEKQSTEPPASSSKNGLLAKMTGTTNTARQMRILRTNGTHIAAVARQISLLAVNDWLAERGKVNGDEAYQELVSRRIEVFKDSTGVLAATTEGAVFGVAGGPLGVIVGASLGFLSSAASLAAKYHGRSVQYTYKVFEQNNQIAYNQAISDINLTFGRLR